MGEFVGEESLSARAVGLVFARGEEDAVTDGEGTGMEPMGKVACGAVSMDAYITEAVAETGLHEIPCFDRKRLPG